MLPRGTTSRITIHDLILVPSCRLGLCVCLYVSISLTLSSFDKIDHRAAARMYTKCKHACTQQTTKTLRNLHRQQRDWVILLGKKMRWNLNVNKDIKTCFRKLKTGYRTHNSREHIRGSTLTPTNFILQHASARLRVQGEFSPSSPNFFLLLTSKIGHIPLFDDE